MSTVPPTEKARATRAALVRSAGEMFEREGYAAVALRDVGSTWEICVVGG